ncbi:Fe-S-containing hydro-lyase [Chitinispirillales bacterium ANBcel5]|uniref:Fe-S-containing hydro-lyase n=1 Tax=Cellulosispirillum alkaliphilum TaxID=3039283 RepID=UPI002A50942F|nr:Fe-S-containing hydro-lyase [Chitinispirillales bacterium ANBcel5]
MNSISLTTPLGKDEIKRLKIGDMVYLSGSVYTARDAAHKRLCALIEAGKTLPLDLKSQVIYYCGPTPPTPQRAIGSAGPTTSSRMDRYTPLLLKNSGLSAMIGKGNRSSQVVKSIVECGAVYFSATGGAGALLSQHIKSAKVLLYEDLGPEAIHELSVENFPLIVAIDSTGRNLFTEGPSEYKKLIGQ